MSFETKTDGVASKLADWNAESIAQFNQWRSVVSRLLDPGATDPSTDELVRASVAMSLGAAQSYARMVSAWVSLGQAFADPNGTPPS